MVLEREVIEGCRAIGDRFREGMTLGYLGMMLRVTGRLDEARASFEQSLTLFEDAPHVRAPLLASLAMVEVDAGRAERALEIAEAARAAAKDRGILEGEAYIRLAHAEALFAVGRHAEAKTAIALARARLLERAGGIRDPAWQRAFLERVREHAQTLARAEEWLRE
jgi:tetratricopeptide (TPR) repeat protein